MRVCDLIKELEVTSGSGLNSFLTIEVSDDPIEVARSQKRFIVRVNNAIKDLSSTFAINDKFVLTREEKITINDNRFVEFGLITVNDRLITTAEFTNVSKEVFYEQRNFNTIEIYNKKHCDVVCVRYYTLSDLVSHWEDEIPLPYVFHEAIKAHIMKSEVTPKFGEEDSGMHYNQWKQEIEKLESMGYRKVDMIGYSDLSHYEKGWYEW